MTPNRFKAGDKVLWAGEHAEVKVAEPDEKGWLVLLAKATGYMLARESTLTPALATHLWCGVEWKVAAERPPKRGEAYLAGGDVYSASVDFNDENPYPILRPVCILPQEETAWRPNTANQAARSQSGQDKEGA